MFKIKCIKRATGIQALIALGDDCRRKFHHTWSGNDGNDNKSNDLAKAKYHRKSGTTTHPVNQPRAVDHLLDGKDIGAGRVVDGVIASVEGRSWRGSLALVASLWRAGAIGRRRIGACEKKREKSVSQHHGIPEDR